jgi:hypothetical protein
MCLASLSLAAISPPDTLKAPKSANLFDETTSDSTKVLVPVGELRAALWYYNNYFIFKVKADELQKVIESYETLFPTIQDTNTKLTAENEQLKSQATSWQIATFTVSGITIGGVVIVVICALTGVFN